MLEGNDLEPNSDLKSTPSLDRKFLRFRLKNFPIGTFGILIVFSAPLVELARFSLSGSLYSHIVLIPVVSVYLVVTNQIPRRGKRKEVRAQGRTAGQKSKVSTSKENLSESDSGESTFDPRPSDLRPATALGAVLVLTSVLGILTYWIFGGQVLGADAAIESRLAWQIGAFLLSLWGVCLITLPYEVVRKFAFPLGFLVFMVPFPPAVLSGIETLLQHGSADAAYGLFRLAGTPIFRQELLLQLPGINLEVAPQCSGIRSSLVLFITSTLAGYMFLRTNWKRAVLVAFIIPLAMLRNGFRIFVIGELCVRIGPEMIHSYIHRQGGPFFFALSLVPLFVLLWALWKSDGRGKMREGTEVMDVS